MNWRTLKGGDYFLYARSFHTAAKKLARTLDLDPGPVERFDDFKAVIEQANSIDPPFHAFRCPADSERPEAVRSTVLNFVHRLDALVELLNRTADALAAEWDLRSVTGKWMDGGDKKPTIQ
jgi:hypothetical protein